MSTDRKELLELQAKATRAGRTVLFNVDHEGRIDSVFYKDPKAGAMSLSRTGITLNPLTFAELERTKPAWYKMPESFTRLEQKPATGRFHAPRGYTPGTTYRLGDTPSREETGGAPFEQRVVTSFAANPYFRAIPTGEKRAPKKGEWYLSGAEVQAYKALADGINSEYLIAKLVRVERVPAVETYRIIG